MLKNSRHKVYESIETGIDKDTAHVNISNERSLISNFVPTDSLQISNIVLSLVLVIIIVAVGVVVRNESVSGPKRAVFYYLYVIRHAEMKYQPLHFCNPPQYPKLPKEIGKCQDGTDNKCGGDFLIESGLKRARCISEKVNFDNLQLIFAQNPGKCDDIGRVKREYQTVIPLSISRNITIDTRFSRGEELLAAKFAARHDSSLLRRKLCEVPHGVGSALFCWNHENMPILLQAFGCDDEMCRVTLEVNQYDVVYRLTMDCSNGNFLSMSKFREDCNP